MIKNNLKNQIEQCLKEIPETRNSDVRLMIEIWQKFYTKYIKCGATGERGIWLKDLFDLPREDNIKRLRAHFQNDKKMYLPTVWSVAKQRKINEDDWKLYMLELNTYKRI